MQRNRINPDQRARSTGMFEPDRLRYHLSQLAELSAITGRQLVLVYESPCWRVVELDTRVSAVGISAEPDPADAISRAANRIRRIEEIAKDGNHRSCKSAS